MRAAREKLNMSQMDFHKESGPDHTSISDLKEAFNAQA